jgi:hypothetical protein
VRLVYVGEGLLSAHPAWLTNGKGPPATIVGLVVVAGVLRPGPSLSARDGLGPSDILGGLSGPNVRPPISRGGLEGCESRRPRARAGSPYRERQNVHAEAAFTINCRRAPAARRL